MTSEIDATVIQKTVDDLFRKYDKDQNDAIDTEEARDLFAELFAMTNGTSVVEEYGDNSE